MAPDSRPPISHPRPPLATRLRKSLEGKRSKPESLSPTGANGFAVQDPEALQNAVDQAINSDVFQAAIAANVAKLIKPSIKSALDTIQPIVEAVYSHEILLRKTNQSVEDLLARMDTIPEDRHEDGRPPLPRERSASGASLYDQEFKTVLEKSSKRTVATLAELSNAVQSNNGRIADVVDRIGGMNDSLGDTRGSVEYLKDSFEQSFLEKSSLQGQLDQVKADIGRILESIQSGGGTRSIFSSHTTKLDAISTDLAGLKGFSEVSDKLEAVSANIRDLKGAVEGGVALNSESFTALDAQIGNVLATVEEHTGTLDEIKKKDSSSGILAAVQRSNDSHDSNTLALGQIKERSLEEPAPIDNSDTVAALQDLKSDLASLKENFETGLASSTENVVDFGSKIDNIFTTLERQNTADRSADILTAVQKSNDSHHSHATALDEIRSLNVTAPVTDHSNLEALETQISSIFTSVNSHITTLDEIKATNAAPTDNAHLDSLQSEISTITATLSLHTQILHEMKDDVNAEILTALYDAGQIQANHTTVLSEIREAAVSDEILTALRSSNEAHAGHATAFEKLESALQVSNDSHAAHSTSLSEIKSRSLEPVPTGESDDVVSLETKISGIVNTLEGQNAALSVIKDITAASNDAHGSHASAFEKLHIAVQESNANHGSHASAFEKLHDAVQQSNDSHATHSTSLDEIKSRSLEPVPQAESDNLVTLEMKIGGIVRTLEDQDITLSAIKEATAASNDSHALHATTLGEIQSRSAEPAPSSDTGIIELAAKIGGIVTTLEEQSFTLSAIKDATNSSVESHAAHATNLSEIRDVAAASTDFHTSHVTTLAEIKEAAVATRELNGAHSTTLADIVIATGTSNEAHASHSTTLAELKAIQPAPVPSDAETQGLAALDTDIKTIITTLASQHNMLSEIKDVTTNPEVLQTVKISHELLISHSSLLDTIREGSSHENILANISSLKNIVEDAKSGVDTHSTLVMDLHSETKDSHSALGAGVEDCSNEIKTVSTSIELLDAKVADLTGGVHLSDRGVAQLKEHATNISVKEIDSTSSLAPESIARELSPEPRFTEPIIVAKEFEVDPVEEPEVIAKELVVEPVPATKELPLHEEATPAEEVHLVLGPEVVKDEPLLKEASLPDESDPVSEIAAPVEEISAPTEDDVQVTDSTPIEDESTPAVEPESILMETAALIEEEPVPSPSQLVNDEPSTPEAILVKATPAAVPAPESTLVLAIPEPDLPREIALGPEALQNDMETLAALEKVTALEDQFEPVPQIAPTADDLVVPEPTKEADASKADNGEDNSNSIQEDEDTSLDLKELDPALEVEDTKPDLEDIKSNLEADEFKADDGDLTPALEVKELKADSEDVKSSLEAGELKVDEDDSKPVLEVEDVKADSVEAKVVSEADDLKVDEDDLEPALETGDVKADSEEVKPVSTAEDSKPVPEVEDVVPDSEVVKSVLEAVDSKADEVDLESAVIPDSEVVKSVLEAGDSKADEVDLEPALIEDTKLASEDLNLAPEVKGTNPDPEDDKLAEDTTKPPEPATEPVTSDPDSNSTSAIESSSMPSLAAKVSTGNGTETPNGKKGKKGKKEKKEKGGKKGKKEKVPFSMDGEDVDGDA